MYFKSVREAEEVKKSVDFTNGTVKIPVAIEANSFNFTASLTDLKYIQLKEQKLKKKLEDIQRNEENQEKRWLSKEERIRADSHGICAYTGRPLDDVGEIDLISNLTQVRGAEDGSQIIFSKIRE